MNNWNPKILIPFYNYSKILSCKSSKTCIAYICDNPKILIKEIIETVSKETYHVDELEY